MPGMTPKDRRAVEAFLEHGWDAMEDDDPEAAEAEARHALEVVPDAAEAHYLLGAALVDQEAYGEALEHLTQALSHFPGDPSIRLDIAASQVGMMRLDEGIRGLTAVVRDDPENPDARYWLAIAHELRGDDAAATECYGQAAALDPECFFQPPRVSESEFEQLIDTATQELPTELRRPLRTAEIAITVMDLPPADLLTSEDPPLSPLLTGVMAGVAEKTDGAAATPEPDAEAEKPQLLLFRKNIERICSTPEEFVEELGLTLLHEIGHYLGYEEEDLAELGQS
jgi:predicted Zn-dependent protease with MMP-like domain